MVRTVMEMMLWVSALFLWVVMLVSSSGCAHIWRGHTRQGVEFKMPPHHCGKATNVVDCAANISDVINAAHAEFETTMKRSLPVDLYRLVDHIEFVGYELHCSSPTGYCSGLLWDREHGFVIQVKSARCVGETSLAHELMHMYLRLVGRPDRDHSNHRLFSKDVQRDRANRLCW